eukprot:3509887-Pyramimonas_sp.AAC.1
MAARRLEWSLRRARSACSTSALLPVRTGECARTKASQQLAYLSIAEGEGAREEVRINSENHSSSPGAWKGPRWDIQRARSR